MIYRWDDLKFQNIVLSGAGYRGVGQKIRLSQGTLPGGIKTNYIYFNSRDDARDGWSSFYIGQVTILKTPEGLAPFENPHEEAY